MVLKQIAKTCNLLISSSFTKVTENPLNSNIYTRSNLVPCFCSHSLYNYCFSYERAILFEGSIIVEKREDGAILSEATIKVHVDGERYVETAEGNGPVNALDKALRMAIERRFPEVADVHLVNYKVRILDEDRGTAATTRVLIDSSDGHESWGSVGVGVNVVEASWQALVDSISFGLLRRSVDDDAQEEKPEGV